MRRIEVCHSGVAALDRKRILRQVVRADGEEVNFLCELLCQNGGCRDLHHHADLHRAGRNALRLQRLLLLTQQGLCLAELIHGADHREHNAHVAIGSRAENGAQLRPEDLRMAERHADGAEAEEGIVLMRQLERRQLLVAADIQRANDERL